MDWLFGWINNLMGGMIVGLANFAADVVKNTFNMDSTNLDGSVATADLAVGTDIGNLVLWLAVPITVGAVVWQIMRSAAGGRLDGILRALIGGVGFVVITRTVFWYGPYAIHGFDETTTALVDYFNQSTGGITDSLMQSLNFTYNSSNDQWETTGGGVWNAPSWMVGGAVSTMVVPIIPFIAVGCLALGGFLLMAMLGFRRWALIVMIGLSALAFMFLPTEKAGRAVPLKWVQIAVSLLVAKPLAAIIIAISAKMLAASGQMNLLMFTVAVVSFMVAAAAPLIAMKFFGFLGVEIGHAYAQAAGEGALRQGAGSAGQAMQTAGQARQFLPRKSASDGGGSSDPVKPIPSSKGAGASGSPAPIAGSAGAKAGAAGGAAGGAAAAAGPIGIAAGAASAVKAGATKVRQGVEGGADAVSNGMGTAPRLARHRPEEGARL
jgi:hypothetical protein